MSEHRAILPVVGVWRHLIKVIVGVLQPLRNRQAILGGLIDILASQRFVLRDAVAAASGRRLQLFTRLAESTLSTRKLVEGAPHLGFIEIGPQNLAEVKLGIRQLPE